jgi:hypothetical protein
VRSLKWLLQNSDMLCGCRELVEYMCFGGLLLDIWGTADSSSPRNSGTAMPRTLSGDGWIVRSSTSTTTPHLSPPTSATTRLETASGAYTALLSWSASSNGSAVRAASVVVAIFPSNGRASTSTGSPDVLPALPTASHTKHVLI